MEGPTRSSMPCFDRRLQQQNNEVLGRDDRFKFEGDAPIVPSRFYGHGDAQTKSNFAFPEQGRAGEVPWPETPSPLQGNYRIGAARNVVWSDRESCNNRPSRAAYSREIWKRNASNQCLQENSCDRLEDAIFTSVDRPPSPSRNGIARNLDFESEINQSVANGLARNLTFDERHYPTPSMRHIKYTSEGPSISSCSVEEKHIPYESVRSSKGGVANEPFVPSANEVAMQKKVSELRVALRASERTRVQVEQETAELRNYLTTVEAAASGLQSRVRELEDLLKFSPKEIPELEELRGKVAEEISIEAQAQAAAAAQAVAVAREATMELDKVKREATALLKSQEEEISRLNLESTHWHVLYQGRVGELESMKEQLEMKQDAEHESRCKKEDALEASRKERTNLQKELEAAKLAAEEKTLQSKKLADALELSKRTTQGLECKLEDMELEKNEITFQNELLEQQVKELQGREVMATIAHYDRELRKVRAVLGGEKAQLLSELTFLRDRNKSLKGNLVEWQEKFNCLSHQVSAHLQQNEQVSINHAGRNEVEDPPNVPPNMQNPAAPDRQDSLDRQQAGSIFPVANCGVLDDGLQANGIGGENYEIFNRGPKGFTDLEVYNIKNCFIPKDRLLTAAHKEILRLKEINQWLLAQVTVRSRKEVAEQIHVNDG